MDDAPARPPRRKGRTLLVMAVVVVLALVAAWLVEASDGTPETRDATQTEPAAASPASPLPPPQPRRSERARAPESTATEAATPVPAEPAVAAAEPTHRVRCVAVSAADGAPVEGVEVLFVASNAVFDRGPHHTTTGADGAGVAEVPDGLVWRAVARKDGLHTERREYVARATEVRFEMKPAIRIEGHVIDADSRAPLSGVAVRAWATHPDFGVQEEVGTKRTTDTEGRFAIEDAPDGRPCRIYAALPGTRTVDAVVTRTGPGPIVELVLGEGGILEGTVFGIDGRPAAGLPVFQIPPGIDIPDPAWADDEVNVGDRVVRGFIFPPVRTDASGRYAFRGVRLPVEGVPQPRLAAARDAEGREARSEPATFTRHGERLTRDVRFLAPPRLTVRLVSAAPLPAGWKVRVYRDGGDPDITKELGPGESAAEFGELRPGRFHVSAEPAGSASGDSWQISRSLDLGAGDPVEVELRIDLPGTVSGFLVDDDGAPAPGIRAGFWSQDDATATQVGTGVRSGADGGFVVSHVLPQRGRLRVAPHERQNDSSRGKGTRSWSEVTLDDVVPGGPPLRIVLHRRCRVTGRARPVPPNLTLHLSASRDAGAASTDARTDDGGRFSFEPEFAGDGVLLVLAQDGFAPVVIDDRRLPPGGTLDLGDVAFAGGRSFTTALRGEDGKPLASAEVWATDPWFDRPLACDGEGRVRAEHLPDRPFHLFVAATATTADWRLAIDARDPPAEVVVGRGVEVRGRVVDAAEAPLRHTVRVLFIPADRGRGVGGRATEVRCGRDGSFVARLQPGRWQASTTAWRGVDGPPGDAFDVAAAGTPPLTLRLGDEKQ